MKITKSYSVSEEHIAVIKAVAKDHGDGSDSAALRYIIDRWVELERRAAQPAAVAAAAGTGGIMMDWNKHKERQQKTLRWLARNPQVFDRRTKDGTGGRVQWSSKPATYNGRECLPWNDVKGRYWYPWRGEVEAQS